MFEQRLDWRSYILPVMATLLIHALLIALVGGDWVPRSDPRPVVEPVKIVKAQLVTLKKPQPVVTPRKPKPQPKAKPEPVKKVEKKPVETIKPKEKPKPVEEPGPSEEELERIKQQQLEQQLSALAAAEDAELQADEDASLIAQYTAMIAQQMHQTWKLPPSARRDMVAIIKIRMVPTGDIVAMTLSQSSGNAAFDQSALLTVEKAGRFAFMKDLPGRLFESHFREFDFLFSPKDKRL